VRTPNAVVSLGIKFVGEKSPPIQQVVGLIAEVGWWWFLL
jgi:hypothetical protein